MSEPAYFPSYLETGTNAILIRRIRDLETRVGALEDANAGPIALESITPSPAALGDWITVLCDQEVAHKDGSMKVAGLVWYSDPDGDKFVIIGTYGGQTPEDFMAYVRPDTLWAGHWFVYLALDPDGTQSESYVEIDIT